MVTSSDLEILSDTITGLTPEQRAQIIRQIQYHLDSPPHEDVFLNKVISLHLPVSCDVTRPMSSKGLARWLWDSPNLYFRKRVLDMGTGCGIQGMTCLLGGADYVLLSDVSQEAVKCAESNLVDSGLGGRADVRVSDLFEQLGGVEPFDLIVFAQPYFVGSPISEYPFTRGMLSGQDLLPRFFQSARHFLRPGGRLALMGWSFAGAASDPVLVGPRYGFEQICKDMYRDDAGVQQGEFHVVLFK